MEARRVRPSSAASRSPGLLIALAALGCATPLAAQVASGDADERTDALTYTRHIAPILVANCSSCHHPGGSAPFSVLSYSEVRARAERIGEAVARGHMPPWLPAEGYGEFVGERRLDEAEIESIARWIAAGAPEGDPTDMPATPHFPRWPLGEPDLVLQAPAYPVPTEGSDVYRNLVLAPGAAAPLFVRAVDLRTGTSGVVHHARLMVDTTSSSRVMDAEDPLPGFDGMDVRTHARNPAGTFVGWTPGRLPHSGYEGLAWPLRPGDDLVLQLHLRPIGRPEAVQPEIGLYLSEAPSTRAAALISLGTEIIDIPAGAVNHVVRDTFVLPVPVRVLSLYPHAHYLATTMEAVARLPDGSQEPLIRIEDWDFNWQDEYRLREPLDLPAGTVLEMRYAYDNSAANPQNPSDPPVRVRYGSRSVDEMADLMVQVVAGDSSDAAILERALAREYERAAVEYFAWHERTLGDGAAERGDLAAALRHYQASLRHRDDADVLLAMVDVALRREDAESAVVIAERAARMTEYEDARALLWLGRAYAAVGRRGEAESALEEALRLVLEAGSTELEREVREALRRLTAPG